MGAVVLSALSTARTLTLGKGEFSQGRNSPKIRRRQRKSETLQHTSDNEAEQLIHQRMNILPPRPTHPRGSGTRLGIFRRERHDDCPFMNKTRYFKLQNKITKRAWSWPLNKVRSATQFCAASLTHEPARHLNAQKMRGHAAIQGKAKSYFSFGAVMNSGAAAGIVTFHSPLFSLGLKGE